MGKAYILVENLSHERSDNKKDPEN